MNTETNFMSFENLTKLIEEHKKETHPYKRYEFDSTSYTLLLISINDLIKENTKLINQQKEFINYLKDGIKLEIQREIVSGEITNKRYILAKILQKYRSIIGDDK